MLHRSWVRVAKRDGRTRFAAMLMKGSCNLYSPCGRRSEQVGDWTAETIADRECVINTYKQARSGGLKELVDVLLVLAGIFQTLKIPRNTKPTIFDAFVTKKLWRSGGLWQYEWRAVKAVRFCCN